MAKNRDLSKLANRLTVDNNYNVGISGSLTVTGSIISTVTTLWSGSAQLPSGVVSGSAQTIANLPSGTVSGSVQVDVMSTTNIARLATTGSNTFQGNQTINGSLVVTGSLTAQQFIVSSSVTYLTESFASGSHKFGDSSDDTHQFTGSLIVSGSVGIYANTTASGSLQINTIGNNGTNALVFNGGTSYVNTYMGSFSEGLYIASNYSYAGSHRSDSSAKRSMEMYMNTDEFDINTMAAATPGTRTRLLTVSGSAAFIGVVRTAPEFTLDVNGDIALNRTNKLMFAGPTAGDRSRSYLTGDGNNNVFLYGPSSNLITTFGYTGQVTMANNLYVNTTTSVTTYNSPALFVSAPAAGVSVPLQVSADSYGRLIRFYNSDYNNSNTGTDIRMGFTTGTGNTGFNMQVYNAGETTYGNLLLQPSYGHVGIGITPSSWGSGTTALQIGTAGSLWNRTSDNLLVLCSNSYFNGTADIQITTNTSNRIYFNNGQINFERAASTAAGSGTPWVTSMTITNNGQLNSTCTTGGINSQVFSSDNANPFGPWFRFTTDANNSSNYYWVASAVTPGETVRGMMLSNGGLKNYQSNNTNLSDIRTKKDITPLDSYWNKFKDIEIVKFKYKDQTHNDFNIGVIAQQVEEVAPEFVDVDGWGKEDSESESPLWSVYTTDLHHATIKVLQEAMIKIEALKVENDNLKDILTRNNLS
jgi:hypothetical protein